MSRSRILIKRDNDKNLVVGVNIHNTRKYFLGIKNNLFYYKDKETNQIKFGLNKHKIFAGITFDQPKLSSSEHILSSDHLEKILLCDNLSDINNYINNNCNKEKLHFNIVFGNQEKCYLSRNILTENVVDIELPVGSSVITSEMYTNSYTRSYAHYYLNNKKISNLSYIKDILSYGNIAYKRSFSSIAMLLSDDKLSRLSAAEDGSFPIYRSFSHFFK